MKNDFFIIIFVILLIFSGFFFSLFFSSSKSPKTLILQTGSKSVNVNAEIADTFLSKMKGLMGRKFLDQNSGMLFIFDKPDYHSFWMMNTTIPLDAIFISENGTVVDIITMQPCKSITCPNYVPKEKALYVLEVNAGFSSRNGFEINKTRLKLPL
ncbi:MAG: DUF192 domain-containing protein [Candidatus Bilamarchaeum sp.]